MSARFYENTLPQLCFNYFLWEPSHLFYVHEREISLLKYTFPATITAKYHDKVEPKTILVNPGPGTSSRIRLKRACRKTDGIFPLLLSFGG